jgi:hypothetical protein
MTEQQRAEYLLKQREARQRKRVVDSIKKLVTCNTIKFITQLSQSTVSAIHHSDNKIQNLLPSFQTGCASPGKHLKSTFVFYANSDTYFMFSNYSSNQDSPGISVLQKSV